MRIAIDLQGYQSESRFRGIGRYSSGLTKAICRHAGNHEIFLVLNGAFRETIEPIRTLFESDLPSDHIKVFETPVPCAENNPDNMWRVRASEILREWFLAGLLPDWVLVTSLFEGWGDDACVSVEEAGLGIRTAVVLHDLIPFIHPESSLDGADHRSWYERKLKSLKKSSLLLSNSESSRQDGIGHLGFFPDRVVNISGGVEERFHRKTMSNEARLELRRKYSLWDKFLLYVPGGFDWRKNFDLFFQAFSMLPKAIRNNHQLVIPGKLPYDKKSALLTSAQKCGVDRNVCLLNYVPDEDLVGLYNETVLFVFPSLYEGLGLPVLEAMACGAPVIGSNSTSIPEVIGFEKALFDPTNSFSLSSKILEFLSDEALRSFSIKHGFEQVGKFSWDRSAVLALGAIETALAMDREERSKKVTVTEVGIFRRNKKKILVLKLDHRGDFLLAVPALKKLRARYPNSEIDLVVGSWNAEIAKTIEVADRVLCFDYFRSQSLFGPAFEKKDFEALSRQLGRYDLAIDLRRQKDTRFILLKIDAVARVGYQTHDEAIDSNLDLCLDTELDVGGTVIRHNLRSSSLQMMDLVNALRSEVTDYIPIPKFQARKEKGLRVAVFPFAGHPIKEWGFKNYERVILALDSDSRVTAINIYASLADEENISEAIRLCKKVVFHYGLDFDSLCSSLSENTVALANNSFGAHIASFVGLPVVGIYGGHERYEEWAPVYASGSVVIHADLPCSPCHLARPTDCSQEMECLSLIKPSMVLETLLSFVEKRESSKEGRAEERGILEGRAGEVDECSRDWPSRVENRWPVSLDAFREIGGPVSPTDRDLKLVAKSISQNHPKRRQKELLVDISELVRRDSKSGIQRVVRSILGEWLVSPPKNYVVQPVYISDEGGVWHYRYARQFSRFQGFPVPDLWKQDFPVEPLDGDIFFAPDLSPYLVSLAYREGLYDEWRSRGTEIYFLVHDLLPVYHPEWFSDGTSDLFAEWLSVIGRISTGLVCNSRATEGDLRAWLADHPVQRSREIKISTFHLGGDFTGNVRKREALVSEEGIPKSGTTFLMVGTLEPRKGHEQVLMAFDLLWKVRSDVNLVIVGKQGWKVDKLVKAIIGHPEFGKRLFWLHWIDDGELEAVYLKADCLIMASRGEGFGLPLVEAIQRDLPVVARDLPVFREVAGEYAFYFSGDSANALFDALIRWIEMKAANRIPPTVRVQVLTWKQSAENLLSCIMPVI